MELIERYLTNVRVLLPVSRREDVTAELRDALMTLRDEQEGELGHPLTQEEDEGLLRDIGHPVLVAAHYQHQQCLVGPELYPVYIFTLKFVLVIIAVVAVVFGIVTAIASSGAAGAAVGRTLAIASTGAFGAVGAITLIFAALQQRLPQLHFLKNWRARDLPRLRSLRVVSWLDDVAAGWIVRVLNGSSASRPVQSVPVPAGPASHRRTVWRLAAAAAAPARAGAVVAPEKPGSHH